jgi:hypothetical protein
MFTEFRLEYLYTKYTDQWFYNPHKPSSVIGVYLGEEPIKSQLDFKRHNINIYVGIGSEYKLYTNLFIFGNINYGIHSETKQSIYSNVETNKIVQKNVVHSPNITRGMFASIGIKYQFGHN